MSELMLELIRSLMRNGVKAPADNIAFIEDGGRFTGNLDEIILDFSEHDKKVAEEKDKQIEELDRMRKSWIEAAVNRSEENRVLKRKIEDLEAIISDGKKPDISVSENGVSMGCECGGYHLAKERIVELEVEINNKNKEIIEKNQRIIDLLNEITEIKKDWCFSRMSELEDRHQSDCIRINQLLTTIDVLTERYQKLREIHGL